MALEAACRGPVAPLRRGPRATSPTARRRAERPLAPLRCATGRAQRWGPGDRMPPRERGRGAMTRLTARAGDGALLAPRLRSGWGSSRASTESPVRLAPASGPRWRRAARSAPVPGLAAERRRRRHVRLGAGCRWARSPTHLGLEQGQRHRAGRAPGREIGLGVVRLDLMGEAGAHRFGSLGSKTPTATRTSGSPTSACAPASPSGSARPTRRGSSSASGASPAGT